MKIVDLGTGDGRFLMNLAKRNKEDYHIGVDLIQDDFRCGNLQFVKADATQYFEPCDVLHINYPWSSLLDSIFSEDFIKRLNCKTMKMTLNTHQIKQVKDFDLDLFLSLYTQNQFAVVNCFQMNKFNMVPTTWGNKLIKGGNRECYYFEFSYGKQ